MESSDETEAEVDVGSGYGIDDASEPASRYTPSLQLGGPLYTGVAADPPQWEVGQSM